MSSLSIGGDPNQVHVPVENLPVSNGKILLMRTENGLVLDPKMGVKVYLNGMRVREPVRVSISDNIQIKGKEGYHNISFKTKSLKKAGSFQTELFHPSPFREMKDHFQRPEVSLSQVDEVLQVDKEYFHKQGEERSRFEKEWWNVVSSIEEKGRGEVRRLWNVFEAGGHVKDGKLYERRTGTKNFNPPTKIAPWAADIYQAWKTQRSFLSVEAQAAKDHWVRAANYLEKNGVDLVFYDDHHERINLNAEEFVNHPNYAELIEKYKGPMAYLSTILLEVPEGILNTPYLKEIHVNTSGIYKGREAGMGIYSASKRTILLFTGTFHGSRQELLAIFTHELHHSTDKRLLSEEWADDPVITEYERDSVKKAYDTLKRNNAILGLDVGPLAAESRKQYQEMDIQEFIAEFGSYFGMGNSVEDYMVRVRRMPNITDPYEVRAALYQLYYVFQKIYGKKPQVTGILDRELRADREEGFIVDGRTIKGIIRADLLAHNQVRHAPGITNLWSRVEKPILDKLLETIVSLQKSEPYLYITVEKVRDMLAMDGISTWLAPMLKNHSEVARIIIRYLLNKPDPRGVSELNQKLNNIYAHSVQPSEASYINSLFKSLVLPIEYDSATRTFQINEHRGEILYDLSYMSLSRLLNAKTNIWHVRSRGSGERVGYIYYDEGNYFYVHGSKARALVDKLEIPRNVPVPLKNFANIRIEGDLPFNLTFNPPYQEKMSEKAQRPVPEAPNALLKFTEEEGIFMRLYGKLQEEIVQSESRMTPIQRLFLSHSLNLLSRGNLVYQKNGRQTSQSFQDTLNLDPESIRWDLPINGTGEEAIFYYAEDGQLIVRNPKGIPGVEIAKRGTEDFYPVETWTIVEDQDRVKIGSKEYRYEVSTGNELAEMTFSNQRDSFQEESYSIRYENQQLKIVRHENSNPVWVHREYGEVFELPDNQRSFFIGEGDVILSSKGLLRVHTQG